MKNSLMRTLSFAGGAVLCCLLLSTPGCVRGYIYTSITKPLDRNLNANKMPQRVSDADTKELSDPFFTSVRVQWDSNAIGDVMTRNDLDNAQFADLETFSLLFGVWKQENVRVSGENATTRPAWAK